MKRSFQVSAFLLLIFLIFSSKSSASFMGTKQVFAGQEEVKLKELGGEIPLQEMEKSESTTQLMGMEACDESGDEECIKRRIISEAHLDYIYTQHHRP